MVVGSRLSTDKTVGAAAEKGQVLYIISGKADTICCHSGHGAWGMEARDKSPTPRLCGLCTWKDRISFLRSEERQMKEDQKFIRATSRNFLCQPLLLLKKRGVWETSSKISLRYFVK